MVGFYASEGQGLCRIALRQWIAVCATRHTNPSVTGYHANNCSTRRVVSVDGGERGTHRRIA
jgi:hypothetical protein